MSSTEQLKLTPGIYHIVVAFGPDGLDGRRLTDGDSFVTISPPNVVPDLKQEWFVTPVKGKEDFVIIERPIVGLLHNYLTYKGAPNEPPKKDDQIVVKIHPTTPFNEWHLALGPGFTVNLLVDHSDLGIAVGPTPVPDPLPDPTLLLNDKDELKWRFLRVRDE